MMKIKKLALLCVMGICSQNLSAAEMAKNATDITASANQSVLKQLPFNDKQDFDDASRGFIATQTPLTIRDAQGNISWDLSDYGFLKGAAPATVNPSLWRNAQLNMNNGLFKVTDGLYQVRGYDLSNMTIIEGKTGLIIIDPLVTTEVAKAALDLYYQNRPHRPVVAVIYTHSHADHYGGVKGVVTEQQVASGQVTVLAPTGFMDAAVSENVLAGNAMSRRTLYQYGAMLPKSPLGQVDAGIGKTTSEGTFTLIAPTDTITRDKEQRVIDGVTMEFQLAPGTEAPAEMLIWLPQFKTLDVAEDAIHSLHNLYTLRGAEVRDASNWWKTLNQSIENYGSRAEIVIAQHQWPVWGQTRIVDFLSGQRDMYKFIHDRSLNLANKGLTMDEVAESVKLPDSLALKWANRGYYGSVSHDAKAVYQRYIGWYSSNPADLNPLPPVEAAKQYVDYMGGADNVLAKARLSFAKGEYRWVAQVLKQVVFADPQNKDARELQADAFEQLGYQSENPTWRNEYLMGAYELRNGIPDLPPISTTSRDMIKAMTPELLLDYMGVRLNTDKANGQHIRLNWQQPGGQQYTIELNNSVIIYEANKQFSDADATLKMDTLSFAKLVMGPTTMRASILKESSTITGDKVKINQLIDMLDNFPGMFNIVTP